MFEQLRKLPAELEHKVKSFSRKRSRRWSNLALLNMGTALLVSCSTIQAAPEPIEQGLIYPGIIKVDKKANVRSAPLLGNNKILGQWHFIESISGTKLPDADYIVVKDPFIVVGDNADDITQDFYSNLWLRVDAGIIGRSEPRTLHFSLANNGYAQFNRGEFPIEATRQLDGTYSAVDNSISFQNPGQIVLPR